MDNTSPLRKTVLGVQMLFVAFGALVLVPILTGLDPSIALFTARCSAMALPPAWLPSSAARPIRPTPK